MRAATFLCIVLVIGGAKADFWDDLLNNVLKPTAQQLVQVGSNALVNLLQQGLSGVGKRGLDADKLQAVLDKAKQVLGDKFEPLKDAIIEGYKELMQFAQMLQSFSWVNKGLTKRDLHKAVDSIVARNQAKIRTVWSDLLQNLGNAGIGLLGQTVSTGLGELQNLLSQGIGNLGGKRDLTTTIANALQPHIDNAVAVAGQVGNTIQGHVNNLWNTVQSIGQLPDKLQPHIDTITGHVQNIIGHGTNAVQSIQDVVTDILSQTFQNIGGNVQGIVSTGGDAVNTAINHVTGGGNKRDIIQSITDALKPHIDNAVQVAGQVSNVVQGHVSNLVNTVQSIGQLPDKLKPHIDTITGHVQNIIGHGTNAVQSIQDAVTAILQETFQNMKPNVSGIVSTGTDALNTAVNHVGQTGK